MSYGVMSYFIRENDITNHVLGNNNPNIIKRVFETQQPYLSQIDEMAQRLNSLSSKQAVTELFAGRLTRTDAFSGAIYWYALERICRSMQLTEPLPNSDFSPISTTAITTLFGTYNVYGSNSPGKLNLPLPQPDDFPILAYIPNSHIKILNKDFSVLALPDTCHAQFKKWLTRTLDMEKDKGALLLYFY